MPGGISPLRCGCWLARRVQAFPLFRSFLYDPGPGVQSASRVPACVRHLNYLSVLKNSEARGMVGRVSSGLRAIWSREACGLRGPRIARKSGNKTCAQNPAAARSARKTSFADHVSKICILSCKRRGGLKLLATENYRRVEPGRPIAKQGQPN